MNMQNGGGGERINQDPGSEAFHNVFIMDFHNVCTAHSITGMRIITGQS